MAGARDITVEGGRMGPEAETPMTITVDQQPTRP
jgi:hypothetical protein